MCIIRKAVDFAREIPKCWGLPPCLMSGIWSATLPGVQVLQLYCPQSPPKNSPGEARRLRRRGWGRRPSYEIQGADKLTRLGAQAIPRNPRRRPTPTFASPRAPIIHVRITSASIISVRITRAANWRQLAATDAKCRQDTQSVSKPMGLISRGGGTPEILKNHPFCTFRISTKPK